MFDLSSEQLPIGELTPYEKNAKKRPKEHMLMAKKLFRLCETSFTKEEPPCIGGASSIP